MDLIRKQRTLAASVVVEGVGYWSGEDVRVELRQAEPHEGITFVRADLSGAPRIAASVENRKEIPRRTVLQSGDAGVEMIEHVMAALAGMNVDNCELWIDRQEMPGCDGSALPFVEAIQSVGVVEQNAVRPSITIREPMRLGNEECWIEARPGAPGKTTIQYDLDYGSTSPIGRQSLEVLLSPRFFSRNLAPSRTFLLQHEAAAMQAQGLGKRTTLGDLLIFDTEGPVGNELRFPDECVRHKILDMVGDLALAGCDIVGRFVAYRSGHRLNAEMVRALVESQVALKRCA